MREDFCEQPLEQKNQIFISQTRSIFETFLVFLMHRPMGSSQKILSVLFGFLLVGVHCKKYLSILEEEENLDFFEIVVEGKAHPS